MIKVIRARYQRHYLFGALLIEQHLEYLATLYLANFTFRNTNTHKHNGTSTLQSPSTLLRLGRRHDPLHQALPHHNLHLPRLHRRRQSPPRRPPNLRRHPSRRRRLRLRRQHLRPAGLLPVRHNGHPHLQCQQQLQYR